MKKFFFSFFIVGCLAGYIWPQPSSLSRGSATLSINPNFFAIKATPGSETKLLKDAIARYTNLFFPFPTGDSVPGTVSVLDVTVSNPDPTPDLQLGVDESYTLDLALDGTASVVAPEIWGALRGLESFSQIIDWDVNTFKYSIANASVTVVDKPRYPWRGLLIDTSRHFLSPDTIYRTIDALAYNKMNTLHWHAVDAQSFPMQSLNYPNLALYGSYNFGLATYTQETMADIINYGYERGVRVVPEFDIPGHAYSWGRYYPIVTQCPTSYAANINNYPLDPSNPLTLEVVQNFLGEMAKIFTDKHLHLGGDEVVFGCWLGNPNVSAWMQQQGYTTGNEVDNYFFGAFQQYCKDFQRTMVVWQDAYDDGVTLGNDTVIEVWSSRATLQTVLTAGYQAILAQGWYLDQQLPNPATPHYGWMDTWQDFYNNEPTANITKNAELILGGEAAMWGEAVDDTTFDERVWPRASAAAERLWSPQSVTDIVDAKNRLIDFRCRMARRGIMGSPIAPGYCPLRLKPSATERRAQNQKPDRR